MLNQLRAKVPAKKTLETRARASPALLRIGKFGLEEKTVRGCLRATAAACSLLLAGCDDLLLISGHPRSHSQCLATRLKDVHTPQGSLAIIAACDSEVPSGTELRRQQKRLEGGIVDGRASVIRCRKV